MPRKSPALVLFGGPPGRLSPAAAARVVLTLPWAAGPLTGDPWLAQLLPVREHNAALMARLAATPPPPGTHVALLLADPLTDWAAVLDRLAGWGVAGVAAFPGLSRFGAGFGDALAQAGLSPAVEAERLAAARAAGFATLAAVWREGAWPKDAAAPDRVLAPPGVRAPAARLGRLLYRADGPVRSEAMRWPEA